MLRIVCFEIPVMGLMEVNDNGHHLTQAQGRLWTPFAPTCTQLAPYLVLCQPQTEIIDIAEHFEYTHAGHLPSVNCGFDTFYHQSEGVS